MSHQLEIHPAQVKILRVLLFQPTANFAALMKATELTSDHFNFHLKSLEKLGLVTKIEAGKYTLTHLGKEHANRLDTESNTVERQPKTAVLLHIVRQTDAGLEILLQQRLKQPYYGFWGKPSGKIKWGETIIQAAQRELFEETGLSCEKPEFIGVYHKTDYNQHTNEILEDKIFFEVLCLNPSGTLTHEFEGGVNLFVAQDQIKNIGKLFEGVDQPIENALRKHPVFIEKNHYYEPSEY